MAEPSEAPREARSEPGTPEAAPTAGALVPCAQCGLSIPEAARLCHHCKSHQDWRGYLSLSSAVLALLVALVSVLSSALPIMVTAIKGEDSRLVFSLPAIRENGILLVASNLGTRPAVIESAGMTIVDGNRLLIAELKDTSAAMVLPGSQQIAFELRLEQPAEEILTLFRDPGPPAAIHIQAREFSGRQRTFDIPLSQRQVLAATVLADRQCDNLPDTPERRRMCPGIPLSPAHALGPREPAEYVAPPIQRRPQEGVRR